MDPISIIGVASAAAQIAQYIAQTIQDLCTLRGKFKDANTTIRLLIGELSTIRAAVSQLRDWAEWNANDSPKEEEYMKGLEVALEGCQAAMEVLAEEIKDLVNGTVTTHDPAAFNLGFMAKAKVIWNDDTMKIHQDRLHAQVQALQLLLQASHCRSSTAQLELLRLKENRRIIQKVADDTRTLRDSMSAANSQSGSGFTIRNNRQSTLGSMVFDFDQGRAASAPYHMAMAGALPASNTKQEVGSQTTRRKPVERCVINNDEGYHSMGASRAETPSTPVTRNLSISSMNGLSRSLSQANLAREARDIFRSRSLSSSKSNSSRPDPPIRRWLSSSSSSFSSSSLSSPSPHVDKFSDLRKKNKFWSGLSRLNTSSTSNLKGSYKRVQSTSPTCARHRGLRGQEMNIHQSIDFGTVDGLEAPALVRAAQAGSRVEVERLIDHGHDIEAFHGPTRRTALAVAAHCGNAEVVETLIQLNAKLKPRDHELATPLHLAASRGHIGVLELLLNEGVQLEETNEKKITALWAAVERGHLEAVELLLQKGAKVNTRAESQLTPLHAAAQRGDVEMIELLLRYGAHMEARDSQFMAALHYACEKGHEGVVDALLDKGASIEALGADGKSPLICAAAEGHCHVVECLMRRKASISSRDERDSNALHWAAYHGHVEVADILLRKKLPINERTADGWTPLHLAVIGSHFSAVEFLLRMNAIIEPQCRQGLTPIHYACGSDNPDIVRLLLGAGSQAEATVAGDLRRPIHIAASKGTVEIVQLLCEKGVEIDTRDSAGDRPLCLAAYYGHAAVVEILLDFQSPLRLPFGDRSYEDSPLCVAAKEGHLDVVSVLLKRGASVRQKDELGWPPIRYAAHCGHPEVLELLLTQVTTLSDDTTTAASDFDMHIASNIGFNVASNISDERKGRVRELLSQAEDQVKAYMAERTMRATTPVFPESQSQRAELPPYQYPEIAPNLTNSRVFRSRVTKSAPPSRPGETHLPKYSPQVFNDTKIDPYISRPNSTLTLSDSTSTPVPTVNPHLLSRSNSLYFNSPSTMSMSPQEAAVLIEDRRSEIAQLQKFLPSIDESSVHVSDLRGYYAPVATSMVYELSSVN